MRTRFLLSSVTAAGALIFAAGGPGGWPHWRGPNDDGMAAGDAPLHWSDSEHIAWKVTVPGHGNSSPVAWGDRIFLTTAVQTGKAPAGIAEAAPPGPPPGPPPDRPRGGPGGGPGGRRRGGFGGNSGPLAEHKFMLISTPAILDGSLYLRGQNTLFCVR